MYCYWCTGGVLVLVYWWTGGLVALAYWGVLVYWCIVYCVLLLIEYVLVHMFSCWLINQSLVRVAVFKFVSPHVLASHGGGCRAPHDGIGFSLNARQCGATKAPAGVGTERWTLAL